MAYHLCYAVIVFIRLRIDFGEYFKLTVEENDRPSVCFLKTKQFKSTRIYTLSQFPRQNFIKKLAIILFAIFLTEGNDFSFFLLQTQRRD